MDEDGVPVEDLLKLKLIVVGDQSTGKSCILNRFVNEIFEENYQATIGLDFQSKNVTIHDQDVRLILYDTAGQEKFRSLIPMYIREAQIILLIYDIANKESFDSIPRWIQEVLDVKNSEAVFALVGNKNDLETERKVTYEEGKNLLKKIILFSRKSVLKMETILKIFLKCNYLKLFIKNLKVNLIKEKKCIMMNKEIMKQKKITIKLTKIMSS